MSWDFFFKRLISKTERDPLPRRVRLLRRALDIAPLWHRQAAAIASYCILGEVRDRADVVREDEVLAWMELMRPDRHSRDRMPKVVIPSGYQLDSDRSFDEKTDELKTFAAFVSKTTEPLTGTTIVTHVLDGGGAVSVAYVAGDDGSEYVVEVPAPVARSLARSARVTWQVHRVLVEGAEPGPQRRLARGGA